jgi:hypothetical protein
MDLVVVLFNMAIRWRNLSRPQRRKAISAHKRPYASTNSGKIRAASEGFERSGEA